MTGRREDRVPLCQRRRSSTPSLQTFDGLEVRLPQKITIFANQIKLNMEKKEFYRRHLPHFQQPGQAYFVTWCIKDAVPPKALESYSKQLKELNNKIDSAKSRKADEKIINELKFEYSKIRKKYIKAYDDLLHLQTEFIVDLSKDENTQTVINALCFWEGKRLENYALCVMSNHVHWVFRVFDKDENCESVYLQDILKSVKQFSANGINKLENRTGSLWHNESFDTTIRDNLHLYNAINYTIENPIAAGLMKDWREWKGTRLFLGRREDGVPLR